MRNAVLPMISMVLLGGCLQAPTIKLSMVLADQDSAYSAGKPDTRRLPRLLASARGDQFGDEIFEVETTATWIVPPIDLLSLRQAAEKNQLSSDEYEARLNRLLALHERYLVFSLNLVMPFYSGWSQSELLKFLDNNLGVTLNTGHEVLFYPERVTFHALEASQFRSRIEQSDDLKISVPVRAYFLREQQGLNLVSAGTSRLVLKLRLKEETPFRIGFFDEKFYQGFVWKIEADI